MRRCQLDSSVRRLCADANEARRWRRLGTWAALALGLFTAGCPDTQGKYDDFGERYQQLFPPDTGSGGAACSAAPAAGELDGEFLFALSAVLSPAKPVLFAAQLTTQDNGGVLEYALSMHALSAADRSTQVGDLIEIGPYPVDADGHFSSAWPTITVVGEANPITGSLIEATIVLDGQMCAGDFVCGTVSGQVTKPLIADLGGSNFTLERAPSPGIYPEPPKIDCDGTLGNPL